jgi:hypothetical protein
MTNNNGETISCLRAAKQIFCSFGKQAEVGDWADCANPHSDIETESASPAEQRRTMALVRKVAGRVAKHLGL